MEKRVSQTFPAPPALEFAIGTGRVAVPLAEPGEAHAPDVRPVLEGVAGELAGLLGLHLEVRRLRSGRGHSPCAAMRITVAGHHEGRVAACPCRM